MMKFKLSTLLGVMLLTATQMAVAQDFDDIYYNASKDNKTQKKTVVVTTPRRTTVTTTTQTTKTTQRYDITPDYKASMRSDDEYNRRGAYDPSIIEVNEENTDTIESSSFANTQRIERFYNPEIVNASGDDELITLYYDYTPTINVIVGSPTYAWSAIYDPWDYWYSPWDYSWRYGWYGGYRYHHWGWNAAWYDPFWHSSWSWGGLWGWHNPAWDWHWHHHYQPHYGGGHWNRPVQRPAMASNGRRPYGGNTRYASGSSTNNIGGGRRPGFATNNSRPQSARSTTNRSSASRPTMGSQGRNANVSGGRRPTVGNIGASGRYPSSTVQSATPSVRSSSSNQPRSSQSSSSYSRPQHATRSNSSSSSSSSSTNNSRSSSSNSYNSGSFGGGSRSSSGGGFSGGGGRRR